MLYPKLNASYKVNITTAIILLFGFIILFEGLWKPLFINKTGLVIALTGSIAPGLYSRVQGKIKVGDYVQVCLGPIPERLALSRGYMSHGNCNGGEYLAKEIIAVPGDTVYVYPDKTVVFDGKDRRTYITPRYLKDYTGQLAVRTISDGVYHLSGYWLLGNGNREYSWDSRYFGQVDRDQIVSKIKPLILF